MTSLSRTPVVFVRLLMLTALAAVAFGLDRGEIVPQPLADIAAREPFDMSGYAAPQSLLTVGTCQSLPGGVIEVEGTGGSGTQPTGYPTLGAAFTAINGGVHTGVIAIDVCGNTTEVASSSILNASGSGSPPASYSSILIQPVGGTARTITAATTAGFPMIDLNGADNVTIDGLNAGGNSLTISNTTVSNMSNTSTIRFVMDASNNLITNVSVLGSATMVVGTNGGNILFGANALATGNDNNTISNCDIGPAGVNFPTKGIHFGGSANPNENSGNTVSGNNIFDYTSTTTTSAGIYVANGTLTSSFTDNRFYQTAPRTHPAQNHAAIQINGSNAGGFTIAGNVIGYSSSSGTGTYEIAGGSANARFYPIYLSLHSSSVPSSIQGNTITNISISGNVSLTPFAGIFIEAGRADVGNVTGNVVGSSTVAGAISVTSSSNSGSNVYGINNSFAGGGASTSNNSVGGIAVANTSAGAIDLFGIRATTNNSSLTSTVQNNTVGYPSAPIVNSSTSTSSNTVGLLANTAQVIATGNTVSNLTTNSANTGTLDNSSLLGISIQATSATSGNDISGNTIRNLTNSDTANNVTVTGLLYNGANGSHFVQRNLIYGLSVGDASSTTGTVNGIDVQGGSTTYQNNMIALGNGVTASNQISGVRETAGSSSLFYHNSIYIGGTAVIGSSATYAMQSTVTSINREYRNNIFVNARSNGGGTGKHYAVRIGGSGANPLGLLINNNVYLANGTGGVFGFYASDRANLAAWQAAIGQDSNSFSNDPQFSNASGAIPDLHISSGSPTVVEAGGADVGVGDDFDGQSRSGLTPTDIGADAGNFTPIGAANLPPVITSTAPTAATEDVLLTYNAASADPDGPGAAWSLLPANTCSGAAIGAATGVYTFTPAGPVPPASCTLAIQVCDGGSPNLCDSQTSTLTITAVNDPPVITSSAALTATEDVLYTYNAVFSDPDGTGSTWETVAPTHTCGGSINGSGGFTFTPAGPIPPTSCVIAIRVCDNGGECSAVQSTTVTITAVNDPPVAVDDNLSTPMNAQLIVTAASLASNDIDDDGPGLTVTAVGNPVNGTVVLNAGNVTFTPTNGFTGAASFEYTVSDGSLTDTGLVNVTVTPPVFSGTISVGTGEAVTSLTNPGGLFEQMNAGTISGNVVVNITSDLTAETGTHSLNHQVETGVGGYTIFVQASGAPRLIEGSNAAALINLNGADRVTFSGLAFGPGGLMFRNTGNGATIRLFNDASSNGIVNCIVEGGTTSISTGVVMIGPGSTTGNDSNSISDSTIRDRTDASAVPLQLIYLEGSGPGTTSGIVIANNQFINFELAAITSVAIENLTINSNTIFHTAALTTSLASIQVLLNMGSSVVSGNTISGHTTNSSFTGLRFEGTAGSLNVSANRIFNIDNTPASTGELTGIQMDVSSSPSSSVTLVNNMISIRPGTASAQAVHGINDRRAAGSLTMNHNTVLVAGPGGGASSWAYRRGAGSSASVSLTNNIFFNERTGGGSDHFAIGDLSGGSGSWSSNYNLYIGSGATPADFFDLNGTAVDFATWQIGPPARDANSIASVAGVGPFNVGNIFLSPNDLHLKVSGNNPAINAGTDAGVATDFDGQARPFNGAPDIGADEVQTAATAADASITGRAITADGRGIKNIRVFVTGGTLTAPRVATTNAFGYFVINGLRAGETYVVSVGGKRFVFDPPARVVSLGEDAAGIDFVAVP